MSDKLQAAIAERQQLLLQAYSFTRQRDDAQAGIDACNNRLRDLTGFIEGHQQAQVEATAKASTERASTE